MIRIALGRCQTLNLRETPDTLRSAMRSLGTLRAPVPRPTPATVAYPHPTTPGRAFAGRRGALAALALAGLVGTGSARIALAQTTLTPWGNVTGMRVDDEPIEFESGLRLVHPDWAGFSSAVKYLQRPRYARSGARGVVESEIEGLAFTKVVTDTAPGVATVELSRPPTAPS